MSTCACFSSRLLALQADEILFGHLVQPRLHLLNAFHLAEPVIHGSLSLAQPGREGGVEVGHEVADGEIEEEHAAGGDERHGDEEDRDLRRHLVGDADREVDDDRVDQERTADAERQQEGGRELVGDVDEGEPADDPLPRRNGPIRVRPGRAGAPSAGR